MRSDFNRATDKAQQAISHDVDHITQASEELSQRTERQAAAAEETAVALDQLTASDLETAKNAAEVDGLVGKAREQSTGLSQLSSTVSELDMTPQKNAAMFEQTTPPARTCATPRRRFGRTSAASNSAAAPETDPPKRPRPDTPPQPEARQSGASVKRRLPQPDQAGSTGSVSYFSRNASAGNARKSANRARSTSCGQSHQASATMRSATSGANRGRSGRAGTPATMV